MQSIAVNPPPMTTTRLPAWPGYGRPRVAVLRYSRPVDHALGVFVRDAELVGVVAAGGHDRGVEAALSQVVQGEVAAEGLVALDLRAEAPDGLVFGLEDFLLGQAVFRDAVAEHAARLRVALEDGRVVAGDLEVVGGGHARRPGADDGDTLAGLGLRLERQRRLDAVLLRREDDVAGVAVAVADRDRLVHLVAAAVLLAWRRADAAQDRGERDGALEDARRLAEAAFGVGLEEARDVDVARALVLAGRQAVGVVVAEDQLQVGPAEAADLVGLGLHDHARYRPRGRTRWPGDRRRRSRPRTCGRRRSPAAWARSTASGLRCRWPGRLRGSSGPRFRRPRGRRSRA